MATQPTPVASISPAEMQILVSRAGLVLNPGQVADLVLAWRQVAALIASIQQARPLADDMAITFRLPPPAQADREAPSRTSGTSARKAAAGGGKPARKPPRPAGAAAAKTRRGAAKAKPSPGRTARGGTSRQKPKRGR